MSAASYSEPMNTDTTQRDAAPWWTSRRAIMASYLQIVVLGTASLCVGIVFGIPWWVPLAACPFILIVPGVIGTRRELRRREAATEAAIRG